MRRRPPFIPFETPVPSCCTFARSVADKFRDQRVIVTGGSSGAGKAIAAAFLERGAAVALVARDTARLAAAHAELAPKGRVLTASCDVSKAAEVARAFSDLDARLDGIDVL